MARCRLLTRAATSKQPPPSRDGSTAISAWPPGWHELAGLHGCPGQVVIAVVATLFV
jgi:hypothetical protein